MSSPDRCSQTSSIRPWLEDHLQDPQDYEASLQLRGNRAYRRSRRHSWRRERHYLGAIESNSVLMPPPVERGKDSPLKPTQEKPPATPVVLVRRTRSSKDGQYDIFQDDDNDQDNDQTPKSSHQAQSLKNAPILVWLDTDKAILHNDSSSNQSSNRRRSPSPRKARRIMRFADTAVKSVEIGTKGVILPAEAKELYSDLQTFQTQRGLIPASIRHIAGSEIRSNDDLLYSDQSDDLTETDFALTHSKIWKNVRFIRASAQQCFNKDAPESTWNMTVHSPILQNALRGHWHSRDIWYTDLTTARISDKAPLPTVHGASLQSKMVDFGTVIQPPLESELEKRIEQKCITQPQQTSNQTDAPHVCGDPIAVSAEVKRAGGKEDEAWVQLGTWVTAHYNKLKTQVVEEEEKNKLISRKAANLPILPLIQIQGHEWKLIIAEPKPERKIILHCGISLGSTKSILGIYQIMASLRRFAQWVSEEYRPWWTKAVIGYDEKNKDKAVQQGDATDECVQPDQIEQLASMTQS